MAGTKKKLDIYFDIAFFQKFYNDKPNNELSKEFQNWLDFYLFFTQSSHIELIDAYDSKPVNQSDILLLLAHPQLIEQNTMTINANYSYNQISNPHSIFFLEFTLEQTESLEQRFGFIFINSHNYLQKWKLLNPRNHQSFKIVSQGGSFSNWDSFNALKHFANSILIIDRYFFMSNSGYSKGNLEGMFGNLFQKIESNLDITIVLGEQVIGKQENKYKRLEYIDSRDNQTIKDCVKDVKNVVKSKVSANCNLSMVQIFRKNGGDVGITHDRRILSNYFYLVSGDSLTYQSEDSNGSKILVNTDFHIYTVFDSNTFFEMQKRLDELKKEVNSQTKEGNFIGTKQNRLLH